MLLHQRIDFPVRTIAAAILAAGGACIAHQEANAASATGGFSVRGLGAQQCGTLTQPAEGEAANAVLETSSAWIAGYLSQHNRLAPETYEAMPIIDNVAVASLALSLCRSNPDALFESVVASLIQSFSRASLADASDVVEIEHDGAVAVLRRGVFLRVQEELIARNLLGPGSADGHYGPRSREAIVAFQSSRGIAASGIPDPQTLIHLFALGRQADDAQSQ